MATRWYKEAKTHLSKDGNHYIVPVVYERIKENEAISQFFEGGDKLNLYKANGLFSDSPAATAVIDSAKQWALEKLALDLAKAINSDHREEAKEVAFLPEDSKTNPKGYGDPDGEDMAEAWYIEARPAEYQNLFLKIMFSKSWADALPPKASPCIDLDDVGHTVMLFIKTLQKDLNDVSSILYHFDYQIQESSVQLPFDAICNAVKMKTVESGLNRILRLNDKPELSDRNTAALQFGFTETFDLQYIAYSEQPDCLCDKENINAYILKKGLEDLKVTPPFDSQTVNGLLYYLPEITRKYSPYLTGGKNKYLFAAQESWLYFVKTFVYPEAEVVFDTSKTKEALFLEKMGAITDISNAVSGLVRKGNYIQDPTLILAPDVRNRILGATRAQTAFGGDAIMMNALTSEIYSLKTLYDRLLNKVPTIELIKFAAAAIVKCVPDNKLKRKLCQIVLKGIPRIEVETKLIPCLRAKGFVGAIAGIQDAMNGRKIQMYQQARARAPEKFQKDASTQMLTEADMAAVNDLYCADPEFQKKLIRPADDFSEEFLLWLQNNATDAICDCVLEVYGPVQQLIGFIEDLSKDAVDVLDVLEDNKTQSVESTTLSLKRMAAPFQAVTGQKGDLAKSIFLGLYQVLQAVTLGAIVVVLNHVKSSVLGDLMKDICKAPGNPFSSKSMTDMIMDSRLYQDQDFSKLKKTIKKLGSMAGLTGEIRDIMRALDKLGEQFTPSEIKRLFTTKCGDDSFDEGYKKALATFRATGAMPAAWPSPSSPTAAYTDGVGPLCPSPDAEKDSIGPVHDFLAGVGNLIDPTQFEDLIEDWEKTKEELINICDPQTPDILNTLDPETFKRMAEKDQDDLLNDLADMMPLLDPSKIEDMMPPLFCGPCAPQKIGQKPLMPSQTHPTQRFLADQFNKGMFEAINEMFNNNVGAYKPVIFNATGIQKVASRILINSQPASYQGMTADERNTAKAEADFAVATAAAENKPTDAIALVGEPLKIAVEEMINTGQQKFNNPTNAPDGYEAYLYDIEGTPYQIILVFNFSGTDVSMTSPYSAVATPTSQIKIVVIAPATSDVVFEWPTISDKVNKIQSFDKDAIVSALTANLKGFETNLSLDPAAQATLKSYIPDITNLIFETILVESMHEDMFNASIFNKIPLTDLETKRMCLEGIGQKTLLDTEGVSEMVGKTARSLECVVSLFDTPNAQQIANMYGLYNLLIKICIAEEYLKNIFIFGFMKIADILRVDAYMSMMVSNIADTVQNVSGQDGYDSLLEYASKIIHGRQNLGEKFSSEQNPGPLGAMPRLLSPAECLHILILETAEEINDILDARIQNIMDPNWLEKFTEYEAIDNIDIELLLNNRILEYVVSSDPKYWSPDLFPFADQTFASGKINPMRYISPPGSGTWPIYTADTPGGWPTRGENENLPWDGGLFFQPYIRVESTITASGESDDSISISGLNSFWQKFNDGAQDLSWHWSEVSSHPILRLLDKVNEEASQFGVMGSPTFIDFFDIFFKPQNTNLTARRAFMRIVSSFEPGKEPIGKWATIKDGFYYWQAITDTTDEKRFHWANRGVSSINRVADPSSLFALLASADPNLDASVDVPGDEGDSWLDQVKDLMIDHLDYGEDLFKKETTTAGVYATDHALTRSFIRMVQRAVFTQHHTHWFDLKLGMRLNSLVPITGDKPLSFLWSHLESMDSEAYNKEKVFIWDNPLHGKKYLCLPIATTEEPMLPLTDARSIAGLGQHMLAQFSLGPYAEGAAPMPNRLRDLKIKLGLGQIKELLPVEELSMVAALLYRYSMESAYPDLDTLFEPSKSITTRFIAQRAATIKGDHQYLDAFANSPDPATQMKNAGPLPAHTFLKFLELALQCGANIIDPTWKTPWFLPGPLTPVGILAKSLATDWTDDKDKEDLDGTISTEGEICPPPPNEDDPGSISAQPPPPEPTVDEVVIKDVKGDEKTVKVPPQSGYKDKFLLILPDDDELYTQLGTVQSPPLTLILTPPAPKTAGDPGTAPTYVGTVDPTKSLTDGFGCTPEGTEWHWTIPTATLVGMQFGGQTVPAADTLRLLLLTFFTANLCGGPVKEFEFSMEDSEIGPGFSVRLDKAPEGTLVDALGIVVVPPW